MAQRCIWVWLAVTLVGHCLCQDPGCDYSQNVQVGQTYYVYSPGYPKNYTGGLTCRWQATCPANYNLLLDCPEINLPESAQCQLDRLLVSRSGDPQLNGADTYCGRGNLLQTSTGQKLSIGLLTSRSTPGGRFSCTLRAQPVTPENNCRCGYKKTNRIVNGVETGVNEFPMMTALYDLRISAIKCGGVVIAERYVLSAAHCLQGQTTSTLAVVVGEHNVNNNNPHRQVLRIAGFIIHPQYSESTYDYDIALLRTTTSIVYNAFVGPVCLPFKFITETFAGAKVEALGWGTLYIGGPSPDALQKVTLDVITQSSCRSKVSTLTSRQVCTFTRGKDSCQDDSGGPLLYTDPSSGLLFSMGIISFGRFCATDGEPGVGTRVTSHLEWIQANTPDATYCVK